MNKDRNSVANGNMVGKLTMIGYSRKIGSMYAMRPTHEGCGCLVTRMKTGPWICGHCGPLSPTIDRKELS
jgi:hypothetical protein